MNISQEEHSQQLQIPGNANRMYTAEEDQEILDHWWDRSARPDLCRRLGRTKAALAQRFYAIIKEKDLPGGVSPSDAGPSTGSSPSRPGDSTQQVRGEKGTRDPLDPGGGNAALAVNPGGNEPRGDQCGN